MLIWRNERGWRGHGGRRCDIHSPEPGSSGFTSAGQDGSASGAKDTHALLVKVHSAVGVTELAKTEEVVDEPWYYVSLARCVVG